MVEDANKTIEFYRTLYVVTKRQQYNFDKNKENNEGRTPLHFASKGSIRIIEELIKAKANVNI